MKLIMTNHAKVERYDRICAIVDLFNGDLGEVVISTAGCQEGRIQELTSKGVVIVRSTDNVLITMFLCNVNKAKFFETQGKFLTRAMWERIKANQKYQKLAA